ncbi:MAG: Holliday junction resolvase RuvX [Holosporaceae bacterium]|jgi:putative Holliday junction resolvase|nr:Holliday junction resolvase RuvX [Holosporaceae bacterium]
MSDFFLKNPIEIKIEEIALLEAVILGLDVGDKTIGVAISDRRIKIASGITTISRNETDRDFKLLLECVRDYKIGLIVFGWPLQMNGLAGNQCEKVLKFAHQLSSFFDIPFIQWDERFSTRAVNNLMIQADLSRKKRRKTIDQGAAVYILQGALDFFNRQSARTTQLT